jgi:hypothetical protein
VKHSTNNLAIVADHQNIVFQEKKIDKDKSKQTRMAIDIQKSDLTVCLPPHYRVDYQLFYGGFGIIL